MSLPEEPTRAAWPRAAGEIVVPLNGEKSHAYGARGRPDDDGGVAALYVFARVLYTRYCALELSTRIFA
jgi:hypothetical protein